MKKDKTIRQIQLIYFAIILLLALFAGLAFYYIQLIGKVGGYSVEVENNLKALNIILALAGMPASYMFHKRKVSHIDKTQSMDKKLIQFRTAFLIKMATLEGISLISVLIYLMTGEINQLMVFGLLYLFILLNFPSVSGIKRDLELNDNNF